MNRVLLRVGLGAAAVGTIAAGIGLTAVAREIGRQSQVDEAQPADVIVVLGAAEYRGRPSPVLEARLNHADDRHEILVEPHDVTDDVRSSTETRLP